MWRLCFSHLGFGFLRRFRIQNWHTAELFVIDGRRDRRMLAAYRAAFVAPQFELPKLHRQRLEERQLSDRRLAYSEDQLDHLVRLERPDDARQHADHST